MIGSKEFYFNYGYWMDNRSKNSENDYKYN